MKKTVIWIIIIAVLCGGWYFWKEWSKTTPETRALQKSAAAEQPAQRQIIEAMRSFYAQEKQSAMASGPVYAEMAFKDYASKTPVFAEQSFIADIKPDPGNRAVFRLTARKKSEVFDRALFYSIEMSNAGRFYCTAYKRDSRAACISLGGKNETADDMNQIWTFWLD